MASLPYITLTTNESGDWSVLEVDCGETFSRSGHSMSKWDWIELLAVLGYKVECEIITDEEMENRYIK
jgi:hypothetical protein